MKNLKNKKAFSIVVAIGLVLVMNLLVLYILEYIVPYSKNVKGIENSTNAFYQAENSIEEGLYFFSTRGTGSIKEFEDKNVPFISGTGVTYKYSTTSSGNTIPSAGEGNSEYDKNFNTISQGNPIQLDIGNNLNINWGNSNTKINFNVPDINKTSTEILSGSTTPIINWQLSSDNNTLNATGSLIKANQINGSDININNFQGIDLNGNEGNSERFQNYYSSNCGTGKKCSLKFSIINKLELDSGNVPVPYLEYKITTNTKIPLRYSKIKSSGKSYGFQKNLEVRVPQQTTNEAFDFTIFQ